MGARSEFKEAPLDSLIVKEEELRHEINRRSQPDPRAAQLWCNVKAELLRRDRKPELARMVLRIGTPSIIGGYGVSNVVGIIQEAMPKRGVRNG